MFDGDLSSSDLNLFYSCFKILNAHTLSITLFIKKALRQNLKTRFFLYRNARLREKVRVFSIYSQDHYGGGSFQLTSVTSKAWTPISLTLDFEHHSEATLINGLIDWTLSTP